MLTMRALASLFLLILPLLTIASPTPPSYKPEARDATSVKLSDRATRETEPRANPLIVIARVIGIVDKVLDLVASLEKDEEREIAFIQNTILELIKEYPKYNVLVYHDEPSKHNSARSFNGVKGNDWACYHVERDRTFGTKGYEVCLLKTGRFLRGYNQEGGTRNWGWRSKAGGGCVNRPEEKTLEFCKI